MVIKLIIHTSIILYIYMEHVTASTHGMAYALKYMLEISVIVKYKRLHHGIWVSHHLPPMLLKSRIADPTDLPSPQAYMLINIILIS